MSSSWWVRMSVIIISIIWGTYILTPTFLAESAQERLERQAAEAKTLQKQEEDERLPDAEALPSWLKTDILSEMRNCKQACTDYEAKPTENEWAGSYFSGEGKTTLNKCLRRALKIETKDSCAKEAIRSCSNTCAVAEMGDYSSTQQAVDGLLKNSLPEGWSLKAEKVEADPTQDPYAKLKTHYLLTLTQAVEPEPGKKKKSKDSDEALAATPVDAGLQQLKDHFKSVADIDISATEKSGVYKLRFSESTYAQMHCAKACLSLHNELPDAPDWAAKYYSETVNKSYGECIDREGQLFLQSKASEDAAAVTSCKEKQVRTCTENCREAGQEELSFGNKSLIAFYPSAKLSLGLDLQGGIDLDLEVEIDEAVNSSVQRDISSIKSRAKAKGLGIADIRKDYASPSLLIAVKEGTTTAQIQGFIDSMMVMMDGSKKYEPPVGVEVEGKPYDKYTITANASKEVAKSSLDQALEKLRSRIDETGVKEPSIVVKGGNRINVQLPGIDDIQQAMSVIGTAALLEFMMVDEDKMSNRRDLDRAIYDAEKNMAFASKNPVEGQPPIGDFTNDEDLTRYLLKQKVLDPGTKLMWEYKPLPGGGGKARVPKGYYVVKDEVILTGDDINNANVSYNQFNEPYVAMEFKPRGAEIFSDVTGKNKGKRFAIVLDKEVRSAPYIREQISGGRASIEMGVQDFQLALQESNVLSLVLRTGALPAPVTVGKVRTVGASLGADAIAAGKRATLVGFGFVLVFMVFRYRKSGLVSVFALLTNVLLVFSLLAAAGATLTLPGIAGIALTIGMAVDCNIIIYERIREEQNLGKNVRAAVGSGFDKALLAVLDANITTFIAGVVLYTYGTGPIKGFAVTLMIGILTTLFTGVFLSRTLMDLLTRKASSRLSI